MSMTDPKAMVVLAVSISPATFSRPGLSFSKALFPFSKALSACSSFSFMAWVLPNKDQA